MAKTIPAIKSARDIIDSMIPQTPEAPASSQPTLREWADDNNVSVGWNPDTKTVTLTSPGNTSIQFGTNNGSGYGVGALNADSYHVVENEKALLDALNMSSATAAAVKTVPTVSTTSAAAKKQNVPKVTEITDETPNYTGTPAMDYEYQREVDALNLKRSQTVSKLTADKLELEDAYSRKLSQLYNQYKDSELSQNEVLAAKGLNGGYADAVNTRRAVSYGGAFEELSAMKNDDLKEVDSAISKAYQSNADELYSLETGYVTQLLKAAQNLESFDYATGVAAATSSARSIIYR